MFSELVDSVILRSGRTDKKAAANVVGYARQILRECQTLQPFERDLTEDQLTANSDPFIWTIPKKFRRMTAVMYNAFIYPPYIPPGKKQYRETRYFYRASDYMAFRGCGDDDAPITIAYLSYFPRYAYYAEGERPAYYDTTAEKWQYLDNGQYVDNLATPELEEAARDKVANWLLEDWNELIFEGTQAKLWTSIDDTRAPRVYRSYKDQQESLIEAEPLAAMTC